VDAGDHGRLERGDVLRGRLDVADASLERGRVLPVHDDTTVLRAQVMDHLAQTISDGR
jgi:hypothetical protein